MKKGLTTILFMVATLALFSPALAGSTVVVHPGNMQGWAFSSESQPGGSGALVTGPASPPMGIGSANLVVNNASQGFILGIAAYQGTPLSAITRLQYSTYRTSGGPALAVSLQFNIDTDLTDSNTGWQGRLVFEPYYTETVLTGVWQTWDPMTQGRWWFTGAPQNTVCGIGNPCSWAQVLSNFPNAGIHSTLGAVLFKAGSGWAGFDGNVDAFTIGINGNDTTYDFEPDKDACKNGGWMINPAFRNQGDCVSYIASEGRRAR